jgi:hypothetical protein
VRGGERPRLASLDPMSRLDVRTAWFIVTAAAVRSLLAVLDRRPQRPYYRFCYGSPRTVGGQQNAPFRPPSLIGLDVNQPHQR